jgi:hypothetical protein
VRLTAAEHFLYLGSGLEWVGCCGGCLCRVLRRGVDVGVSMRCALKMEVQIFLGVSQSVTPSMGRLHGSFCGSQPRSASANRRSDAFLSLGPWPGLKGLGLAVFGESHSAFVDARAASLHFTSALHDRAPRMLAGPRIPDIVINRNLEWVESSKTRA